MAIKIPSKNIFGKTYKLPKNHIDSVEYTNTDLKEVIDYDAIIYDHKISSFSLDYKEQFSIGVARPTGSFLGYSAYASTKAYYCRTTIKIPKSADMGKGRISLLDGAKIKYSITCDHTYADIESNSAISVDMNNTSKWSGQYNRNAETKKNQITTVNETFYVYVSLDNISKIFTQTQIGTGNTEVVANATLPTTNIISVNEDDTNYYVYVDLSVGYEKKNLIGYGESTGANIQVPMYSNPEAYGYEHIEPKEVSFTFYGNINKLEKVETAFTFGDGKNSFKLEANETLQGDTITSPTLNDIPVSLSTESTMGGTIITASIESPIDGDLEVNVSTGFMSQEKILIKKGNVVGNVFSRVTNPNVSLNYVYMSPSANQLIASDIISKHKNGKETVELSCSIGEYYNENGSVAIGPNRSGYPMVFKVGDVVLPYTYTSNGDRPLSMKDGQPKQFIITGIEYLFGGAIRQNLTLQEV